MSSKKAPAKIPFDPQRGPITIAFGSPKGGPGKTTLSVNIALELQRRCAGPVRLADVDYTGNAYKHISRGVPEEGGIQMEAEHVFSLVNDPRALAHKISRMSEGAQFLILDTPGAIENKGAQTCLQAADIAVIPLTPSQYDLEATQDALNLMDRIAAVNPEQLQVVVVNRPEKTSIAAQIVEFVREEIASRKGVVLADTFIRQSVGFKEAALLGVPVWSLGRSGKNPAADISSFCDELLNNYRNRSNG